MGPFFRNLRQELQQAGVQAWKVNFNAGDALFDRGASCIPYRGTVEEWPAFFARIVEDLSIDSVFLFGDGRSYHRDIRDIAERKGVRRFVFEEGYLRPGFVTVEQDGVNARSRLPRTPERYLETASVHDQYVPMPVPEGKPAFWYTAFYSSLYSLAMTFANGQYAHYRHHRPMHAKDEAFAWVRSGARKLAYQRTEAKVLRTLTSTWSGRYFLVPLQVYCDYQLVHAPYRTMPEMIDATARDFRANAPADTALVFKHHPLDRGYTDFTQTIDAVGRDTGLTGRLFYVHDLHLPTLLRHSLGCVTLNSTVGMEALRYGTPVKALGDAVYNIEGLADQKPLGKFWTQPEPARPDVYRAFKAWLVYHNQVRGNFYRRYPVVDSPTTFDWPPGVRELEGSAPPLDGACSCTKWANGVG